MPNNPPKRQTPLPIPGIRHIIAIASGKGGVGKSTVAVNLALGLQSQGARVGLLDADIYGPSQPHLLGLTQAGKPAIQDGRFQPHRARGLVSMSIGYLIDAEAPTIWRGPMVSGALLQMLNQTAWGPLDYLIVDLPPGTGDIQLTLAQKIPVCGAVIVTTPESLALADAKKAIAMFVKLNTTVLGIVENMSTFVCPHCAHDTAIFGKDGGEALAKQYDIPLLATLPLSPIFQGPSREDEAALYYADIARKVRDALAKQPRDLRIGIAVRST